MSLVTAVQSNFLHADVATVTSLTADATKCVNLQGTVINANNTTVASTATVTTLQSINAVVSAVNATSVNTSLLLPTSASFATPPTCATQPTGDDQLANKAYVDAAIGGGGGGGGGVETVTGTGAISATVQTTLLSGTEHTLPLSTTKGAEKIIVNMNDNALSRVFTQPIGVFTPAVDNTQIQTMVFDSVANRMYVGGKFESLNGVNTKGVGYYDFNDNQWKPMGNGLVDATFTFTSNLAVNSILVKGTRVYVGGTFTNALDVNGDAVDNTKNVAYYDTGSNTWFSLDESTNIFNATVWNIRSFSTSQVYIVGQFNSRVAMFDESNPATITTYNVDTNTQLMRDCLVINNRLFVCGDFTSLVKAGLETVPNTRYLAYYDFGASNWFGYNSNQQLNSNVNQFTVFQGNVLINGSFLGTGTSTVPLVPLAECTTVAIVTTTGTPTVTQFSPAPVTSAVQLTTDKLHVIDNTLWYTTGEFSSSSNLRILNETTIVSSSAINKQVFWAGLMKYNDTEQYWEPVALLPCLALAPTNNPNVKWIGTTATTVVNNIVNGHGGLIRFDESQVQTVTSTFNENSTPRTKFRLTYQDQTVTLVNADNLQWTLTGVSSGSASGSQLSAPIPFF